jgi:hypothetical protein
MKLPPPVPFEVLLFEMLGSGVVPQQTPCAVTGSPPSVTTFPPVLAELTVILVTMDVVTVGTSFVADLLQLNVMIATRKSAQTV